MKKRTLKVLRNRLLATMLTVVLSMPSTGIPLIAATAKRERKPVHYSQELVAELQKLCTNGEQAKDILDELYQDGFIDETGMPIEGSNFNVDGKKMSEEQLIKKAKKMKTGNVCLDGNDVTWEEINRLITLKEELKELHEFMDSDVDINERNQGEYVASIQSLTEQLKEGSVKLYNNPATSTYGSGVSHQARVTLSPDRTTLTETGSNQIVTVRVNLITKQNVPVTFRYEALSGSASAGGSGTVTIPAGETSAQFQVTYYGSNEKRNGKRLFYISCSDISNALFSSGEYGGRHVTLSIAVKKQDVFQYTHTIGASISCEFNQAYDKNGYIDGLVSGMKGRCYLSYGMIAPYLNRCEDKIVTSEFDGCFHVTCMDVGTNGVKNYAKFSGNVRVSKDDLPSGRNPYISPKWKIDESVDIKFGTPRPRSRISYGGPVCRVSIQEIHEKIALSRLTIPSGTFYSGQLIPITAAFDDYINIDNTIHLKMADGKVLTPEESGTVGNSCTFLYRVPEVPSGNIPDITELSINGTKSFSNDQLFIRNQSKANNKFDLMRLANDDSRTFMIGNRECYLRNYKDASFSDIKCSIDDEQAGSQWVTEVIGVNQSERGFYRKWIQTNCEPIDKLDLKERNDLRSGKEVQESLKESSYALYADESSYMITEYVKSLYLSVDGGITRIPFYVVAKRGNTTETNEIPVALIAQYKPELNIGTEPRMDVAELFLDPNIESTYDYIREREKAALIFSNTSKNVVAVQSYKVKNAVFAYPGAAVIDYSNSNPFLSNWTDLVDNQADLVSYHLSYDGNIKNIVTSDKENPEYLESSNGTTYSSVTEKEKEITLSDSITTKQYVINNPFVTKGFRVEEDELSITAKFQPKTEFSFYGTDNLIWISSDETIANVKYPDEFVGENGKNYGKDHTAKVTIVPTGKEGTVYFTLYALNNGLKGYTPVEVCKTVTLFCQPGKEPFLKFPAPKGNKPVFTGMQNHSLDIRFCSNITTQNAKEATDLQCLGNYEQNQYPTEFTLEVYEADSDGKAQGEAVYTKTIASTIDKTIGKIAIPKDVLQKNSQSTNPVYVARVSAKRLLGVLGKEGLEPKWDEISVEAGIIVIPNPPELCLGKLKSYSILDNTTLSISYKLETFGAALAASGLTITDSDGNTVLSQPLKNGAQTVRFKPAKVSKALKQTYVVKASVQARTGETPVIDSYILSVYNHNVLDVLVNAVDGKTISGENNKDAITFDNHAKLKSLLSKDGKTITLDGEKISLEGLSQDYYLQAMISINYNDYVWGQISDQIIWDVKEEGKRKKQETDLHETPATLNYEQGGTYSDIRAYDYVSYSPSEKFMAVGLDNGKTVLTATHARTGMKSKIAITTKTLKNQFFLFKFLPAVKTKLEYKNGKGKTCTVETDDNGELALYEESGIASDIQLYSEYNGESYIGTIIRKNAMSGEQDISKMHHYPVNNYKLHAITNVHVYIKDEFGNPYSNKPIWIRGGVYKNKEYCYAAKLGTFKKHLDDGKKDQIFTTDSNGKITIYYDASQFYHKNEETLADRALTTEDYILYMLELKFQPNQKNYKEEKVYEPQMIRVSSMLNPYDVVNDCNVTVQARTGKNAPNTAVVNSQLLCQYDNKGYIGDVTDVYDYNGAIGISKHYPKAVLETESIMWGEEVETEPFVYTDSKGNEVPYGEAAKKIEENKYQVLLEDSYGARFTCQTSKVVYYPFADMPIVENVWKLKKSEIDKQIEQNQETSLNIKVLQDNCQVKEAANTFSCVNKSDTDAIEGNEEVKSNIQDMLDSISSNLDWTGPLKDQIKLDSLFEFANNGMSKLISKTGLPLDAKIATTKDPRCFRVMVTLGDFCMDDSEDSNVEEGRTENGGVYSARHNNNECTNEEYEKLWQNGKDKVAKVIADYKREEDKKRGQTIYEGTLGNAQLLYGGAAFLEIRYTDEGKWVVVFCRGGFHGGFDGNLEYNQNFAVGPIPCTVGLRVGLYADAGFYGALTAKQKDIEQRNSYLTTVETEMLCDAFAGVGFDCGAVSLKMGVFGTVTGHYRLKHLDGWKVDYANKKLDKEKMNGTRTTVVGAFGLRLVAKCLFSTYKKNIVSTSHNFINREYGDNEKIDNYWLDAVSGSDTSSRENGVTLLSLDEFSMESRAYLESSEERAWIGGNNTVPDKEGNSSVKMIQKNAYTFAEPICNEDGSLLVYLSDSDSTELEDTLASYAKLENGSYVDKHGIDPVTYVTDELNNETGAAGKDNLLDPVYDADGKVINKYRKTERTGYGDSTVRIAGTKDFSVATFVRQMEPIPDMEQNNPADYDMSSMLNQAEVYASVWLDGTWSTCKLTDNVNCDFSPAVAVNDKYAIVSWRSCIGTDSENPLDFNVQDQIKARIYDKEKNTWGNAITLYNGTAGSVLGLETAMMSDGTAMTAYSIKTGDDENNYDTEIMYTVTKADGTMAESIRVTNDNNLDQNVQVCTVNWNGKEHFIAGWYNQSIFEKTDAVGNSMAIQDIRLLAVNAAGLPSSEFAESVRVAGAEVNSSLFRFSKPEQNADLEDLSLVWLDIETDTKDNDNAESNEHKNTFTLYAMRFTQNNGKILMSVPTEAARMTSGDTIDNFTCYGNRKNLHAVLQSSNYDIDLEDPSTYTVEKVKSEDGEAESKELTDVYIPVGKTALYTVTTNYILCGVQTEGPIVDQDKVLSGFSIPIDFVVKNSGIEKITKLLVTIDGKSTEVATELLPGESQTVTAFYEVPEDSILDVNYSITAESKNGISSPENCSGIVKLNKPEISITSTKVVKEEQKTRTIQVALENESQVPLENGGKTLNIALYDRNPDIQDKEMKPMESVVIKDNQTLALLDAKAYTYQFDISEEKMEQLLEKQFTKQQLEESNHEIPEENIKLYVKSWLTDEDGQVEERYMDDNEAMVELQGLMDQSKNEITLGSRIEKTETGVDAIVSMQNNSFANTYKGNLIACLTDKDGKIVSKLKQTYSKEEQDNGFVTIPQEGKQDVTIHFAEEDLLEGVKSDDVVFVSVSCGRVNEKDTSVEAQSIQVRGQKVQAGLFDELVSKNQKPRTEKKLVTENGEQVEKPVEIRTRYFNAHEVLNEEMLDTIISVMPKNPGNEVTITNGDKKCTDGIGAQMSNIKLHKGSNTVKTTIRGDIFKEMDITRKTVEIKKDKRGKEISKKVKKVTTRYQVDGDGKPIDENGQLVDLTAEDIESCQDVYVQKESVYTAVLVSRNENSQELNADVKKQSLDNKLLLLKATMVKAKKGKTQSCKLSWNKIKDADGYLVYGARITKTKKGSKEAPMKLLAALKGHNKTKYTHKNLKSNYGYRYQVKAYKLVKGKKKGMNESLIVYTFALDKNSKYGNPAKITVKKNSLNLLAGKTETIQATVVTEGKKKRKKLCAEKRYLTSDSSIVTVSKNGKITAKKKGECYVYVVAQNGVVKRIKVKVS